MHKYRLLKSIQCFLYDLVLRHKLLFSTETISPALNVPYLHTVDCVDITPHRLFGICVIFFNRKHTELFCFCLCRTVN